jgi:hypothetical protein
MDVSRETMVTRGAELEMEQKSVDLVHNYKYFADYYLVQQEIMTVLDVYHLFSDFQLVLQQLIVGSIYCSFSGIMSTQS